MTKDNQPITKKDFFAGLAEFFEKILAPYLEERFGKVENRLDGVENRLDGVEDQLISMDRKLDLVAEKTTAHEKRITILETSPKIA